MAGRSSILLLVVLACALGVTWVSLDAGLPVQDPSVAQDLVASETLGARASDEGDADRARQVAAEPPPSPLARMVRMRREMRGALPPTVRVDGRLDFAEILASAVPVEDLSWAPREDDGSVRRRFDAPPPDPRAPSAERPAPQPVAPPEQPGATAAEVARADPAGEPGSAPSGVPVPVIRTEEAEEDAPPIPSLPSDSPPEFPAGSVPVDVGPVDGDAILRLLYRSFRDRLPIYFRSAEERDEFLRAEIPHPVSSDYGFAPLLHLLAEHVGYRSGVSEGRVYLLRTERTPVEED